MDYEEERKEFEVPPATGVPGYLRMIGDILALPRVQEIVMTQGKVAYRRFRKADEPERAIDTDLSSLMPSQVIRNAQLSELTINTNNAAGVLGRMFAQAHMDGFSPVAFVSGSKSTFFAWHLRSTEVRLPHDEVYGIPFLGDSQIPDESLILCAAYTRRSALADTVRAYKISIPIFTARTQ